MLVNRRTFITKQGTAEQAIGQLKTEATTMNWPHALRFYISSIGEFSRIAFEAEFGTLAQYEEFWNEWESRSTTANFFEQWRELTEPGGSNEIWTIEDFVA